MRCKKCNIEVQGGANACQFCGERTGAGAADLEEELIIKVPIKKKQ